ncbi:MAG: nicotinate phosphoribosyltransferase, partial [Promethearchaeota archaeon]
MTKNLDDVENFKNKFLYFENEKDISAFLMLTDYYEFSMANGYLKAGIAEKNATFDYFFRKNPFKGNYAIFVGLEKLLEIIEFFKFSEEDLEVLKDYPQLDDEFIDYLAKMENKLTIRAIPEGRVVFANEPILEVSGPIIQCQLIETFLLNLLNFSTLCATKANRMWLACDKQPILEFGARRSQGPDGAVSATIASIIGGCAGTSNVLAAKKLGIKAIGTQAHSWVMSFPSEFDAFKKYVDIYPDNSILLIDTYSTESGVKNAIKVGKLLRNMGKDLKAIRLDSGDLPELSKIARKLLDDAGFINTQIIISGDIDEYKIIEFKKKGGIADTWGIGTRLTTAWGQPALGGVYKLTEFDNAPKIKISSETIKTTLPSSKQIYRLYKIKKGSNDQGAPKNNAERHFILYADVILHQDENDQYFSQISEHQP